MKKNLVVLICLLLISTLFTGCQFFLHVSFYGGSITGYVYEDDDGSIIIAPEDMSTAGYTPLAGVTVRVHNVLGRGIKKLEAITTTRADGRFFFMTFRPGTSALRSNGAVKCTRLGCTSLRARFQCLIGLRRIRRFTM